ncbi:hypothetical protein Aperf_G00000004259 [Anoplocephala perfoliata]
MNYASRALFLQEHESIMRSRFDPIVNKICGRTQGTKEEYENIYRLIVSGTILYSRLGSSKRLAIIREATSILQTYLPMPDMPMFCSLPPDERKEKFFQLVELVLGTRVYNFSLGFGGEGIDNCLYLKLAAFDTNCETLPNVAAVEAERMGLSRSLLKAATINARQLASYLRHVRCELVDIDDDRRKDKQLLVGILGEVLNCLRTGSNLSDADLQNQILDLARVWTRFKENTTFIALVSNILNSLQEFSFRRYVLLEESRLLNLIHRAEIISDEKWKNATAQVQPRNENKSKWIFPASDSEIKVDLNGFCAWSLVRYQGLPIPCAPNIGVFVHEGRKYGFSSVDAAMQFDAAPEMFINEITTVIRRNPELIKLLDATSLFEEDYACFLKKPKQAVPLKKKKDEEIQTVVHPIASYIDSKYTWNEWELRRRALQLAHIRKCVTHSVQTALSNYRRENETQVYLPKEKYAQTKRDNYSQVPKPSVFIKGLRDSSVIDEKESPNEAVKGIPYTKGRKNYHFVNATKVDLTLPVEDHFCGENNDLKVLTKTKSK